METPSARRFSEKAAISHLRIWAAFGKQLAARRHHPRLTWSGTRRLIETVKPCLAAEANRLRNLLDQSRKRLHPLQEPFDVNLGVHRWLAAEREEAYSDWLHWIFEQMESARLVFQILGIPEPADVASWEFTKPRFWREYCIPYGHENHEGRLDLVIRYDDYALVLVELKKVPEMSADTAKHPGYTKWLQELKPQTMKRYQVLLVVEAGQTGRTDGFHVVSWETICAQLRRVASRFCSDGRLMQAAMILAFVAAVEQNLLGFSHEVVRNVSKGQMARFNTGLVDYLESSLLEGITVARQD